MKNLFQPIHLLFSCCMLLSVFQTADAQLLKRIRDEVKTRVTNQAVNTSGNAVDAVINKGKKNIGDAVKAEGASAGTAKQDQQNTTRSGSDAGYRSYDFIPGDRIIFQPDLSNEPDAELPARFTLNEGNAEIQSYEGEKILHIDAGSHEVVSPLMNSDNYLPEQFTVEFDMMYENSDTYFKYVNSFEVQFRQRGDNNYGNFPLFCFSIESGTGGIWGKYGTKMVHFPDAVSNSLSANNTWHHIAIYVRKNIGKVYIDQYRVAASNTIPTGAGHLALSGDAHYGFKIKNMRIAAGGDDKYQRIVTDGKFITHGILFDVNQSVIKPESMGTLNEVSKLMKDHTDLKFEIDGHTDNDGADNVNMKLSQDRADAVKAKLIEMGIDGSRLSCKGFGASKPIDKNDSAEGKANNRRVEFIKM